MYSHHSPSVDRRRVDCIRDQGPISVGVLKAGWHVGYANTGPNRPLDGASSGENAVNLAFPQGYNKPFNIKNLNSRLSILNDPTEFFRELGELHVDGSAV